ncbi:MAG TPA: hypothetical protein VFJ57_09715 [Solirubrobacterales bacterium]|nr:hypothetical protein [Solirubrobacterales bacterium]
MGLRDSFHADRVPPWELRHILEMHFDGASFEGGDRVVYAREGQPALAVTHTKGEIKEIEALPGLSDADVSEISEKVAEGALADSVQMVRRDFVFCRSPVPAGWRYRDSFQISPAPEQAPRPPWLVGEHPMVLEVPYRDSPVGAIGQTRASQAVFEINLILSGLIPSILAKQPWRSMQQWAIVMEDDDLPRRSVWTQPVYLCERFDHVSDGFSLLQTELKLVADGEFFTPWGGAASDEGLLLPASLERMLDGFNSLDLERRDRFLRWCYWLNFSKLSGGLSMSASYLAIIQAVEALRPEVSSEPCACCGKQTGPGPTRQFIDFMDRYAPRQDDETERERGRLYGLRSALTHGGKLMAWDTELGFGSFYPAAINESDSARRASFLVRLAGVNWLLAAAQS